MADVPDRDSKERTLARKLARLFRAFLGHVTELIDDTPDIAEIPQELFDELTQEEISTLLPFIERTAIESAERMIETIPLGVDWGLVNEGAVSWARDYTYDLVSGIDNTSRRLLQDKIASYYRDGLTIGDLNESLTSAFGPVRADMIASTEVTRASVQGEMQIVRELENQGVIMVAVWQTNNDEVVCPICGPLHGTRRGTEWIDPPPAHPRCRCWINHEFVDEA